MNPVYLTQEECDKLKQDLHHLKYVERPKIAKSIAAAREQGDLRENAEYTAAKENQVLLENKIQRLEFTLARVRIIDPKQMESDKAHVGSRVTLLNLNTNKTMTGILASTADVDIYGDMDVISLESPVGKLLIGKSVDDVIEINNTSGKLSFKIIELKQ